MKKSIITLLLASFILTEITPAACFAIGNKNQSNEPKKVSITKTHKQREKSDEFKYEYINYNWWKNFNDDILNGYIDKAIKNNYDLKMATNTVDEYYQAVKIQFANELPMAGVGLGSGYSKMSGNNSADWAFAMPAFASYEVDLFLKNHDKTNASKKQYEFNMKNNTIKEIGNETTGVKIYNNETNDWNKVPAIKAVNEELLFTKDGNNVSVEGYAKVDKMGDDKQGYYFYYKKVDDKYLVYRANNQNKSQLTYLFTTSKIDDIIYFSDSVYFVDGEFIKRYSDKQGVRNIISYSELKFNDNLYFYVYKK